MLSIIKATETKRMDTGYEKQPVTRLPDRSVKAEGGCRQYTKPASGSHQAQHTEGSLPTIIWAHEHFPQFPKVCVCVINL